MTPLRFPSPRSQAGLSLVELMISIVLGLLILAAVSYIFANNARTRDELEQMSQQVENGRYALQLLGEDLQMAGYYGEHWPVTTTGSQFCEAVPAAIPDPCDSTLGSIRTNMLMHVQGFNNANALSCITDYKTGTDVIVVRRASTCTSSNPAETNCESIVSGAPYLQASGCSAGASPDTIKCNIDSTTGNLTLRKVDCSSTAGIRRYRTHIYFVANNNLSGDGIPTLKRAELGAEGFTVVPLVAGIENLQFEYGVDTTSDGATDSYTSAPADITAWLNVMLVKIHLLARNESMAPPSYSDTKSYVLGDETIAATSDRYRRHAYSTVVKLVNPAGRRELQ